MLPKIAHILSWDCPEQCGPCHRWSPVNEVGEYVFCVGAYMWGGGRFPCYVFHTFMWEGDFSAMSIVHILYFVIQVEKT